MRFQLDYFKPSGKWYGSGQYTTDANSSFWDVVAEVRAMAEMGRLPGLVEGSKSFHVLIRTDEKPEWGVPHMIWAGGKISTDYN